MKRDVQHVYSPPAPVTDWFSGLPVELVNHVSAQCYNHHWFYVDRAQYFTCRPELSRHRFFSTEAFRAFRTFKQHGYLARLNRANRDGFAQRYTDSDFRQMVTDLIVHYEKTDCQTDERQAMRVLLASVTGGSTRLCNLVVETVKPAEAPQFTEDLERDITALNLNKKLPALINRSEYDTRHHMMLRIQKNMWRLSAEEVLRLGLVVAALIPFARYEHVCVTPRYDTSVWGDLVVYQENSAPAAMQPAFYVPVMERRDCFAVHEADTTIDLRQLQRLSEPLNYGKARIFAIRGLTGVMQSQYGERLDRDGEKSPLPVGYMMRRMSLSRQFQTTLLRTGDHIDALVKESRRPSRAIGRGIGKQAT